MLKISSVILFPKWSPNVWKECSSVSWHNTEQSLTVWESKRHLKQPDRKVQMSCRPLYHYFTHLETKCQAVQVRYFLCPSAVTGEKMWAHLYLQNLVGGHAAPSTASLMKLTQEAGCAGEAGGCWSPSPAVGKTGFGNKLLSQSLESIITGLKKVLSCSVCEVNMCVKHQFASENCLNLFGNLAEYTQKVHYIYS